MIEYRIHKTARGQFRVTNHADRELGKFDSEAEAQAFVAGQQAADAERLAATEATIAADFAYDASVPTLTEAQLTWQEWRNWFYGAMIWAARDTARMQRALARQGEFAGRYSYDKQQIYLAQAMREDLDARDLYNQALNLDRKIKDARRNRDTAALAAALAEASQLIEEMRPYFQNMGLPQPEPRKRAGTAPNTSVILTDAELRFIEEQFGGSKSAAIHEALQRLITEAKRLPRRGK